MSLARHDVDRVRLVTREMAITVSPAHHVSLTTVAATRALIVLMRLNSDQVPSPANVLMA